MVNLAKSTQYSTTWCIDWISATFKTDTVSELDVRRALNLGFKMRAWVESKPHFGYALAMTHPLGHTVYSNPYRPEMGVHVTMGGRALKAMSEGGLTQDQLLSWVLDHGGKITRLDLALDVFGEKIDPIALARTPQVPGAEGSARRRRSVEGEEGGKTAYVGSRKSEKFLRIYDKAIEQGLLDTLWTRLEVEMKGDAARTAARSLLLMPDEARGDLVRGIIRGLFNPNDAVFQGFMAAPHVKLASPERNTEDKTHKWVMNQVARALAGLMIRRTDTDIWGEFVAAVHANVRAMGGTFEQEDGEYAG